MKNHFYSLLLVFGVLFLLSSCSKDDNGGEAESGFSVDKTALSVINATSGTFKVNASAGMAWKITVPAAAASWLKVEPVEGVGPETITCSTVKALYREKRQATLSIFPTEGSAAIITVKDSLPNQLPSAVAVASYPADGAKDVKDASLRFSWEPASDPDNDKLFYSFEYSTDQNKWTSVNQKLEVPFYTLSSDKLTGNTTYYWRVKATDLFGGESPVSKAFSFTTAAAPGDWKDGEVRVFQECIRKDAKDPFTVIVTGDGYTAADLKAGGLWDTYSQSAIQGLLSDIEPYKTWGSYLRFIRIAAESEESGVSEHQSGDQSGICTKVVKTKFGTMYDNVSSSSWCGLFSNESPSTGGSFQKTFDWVDSRLKEAGLNVTKNYAVIVIMNATHHNGTVNYMVESDRTMGFVCTTGGSGNSSFANLIAHEVGGHAIGHLADLYTRAGALTDAKKTQTLNMQKYGWYQNVSVSSSQKSAPWGFFFEKPEHSIYYSKVGMFEGARSAQKGIWRPESEPTCMNDNRLYYDAPSRWSIVRDLKKSVGEELTWEEFVNKDYDRENVDFTKSQQVPYEILPHTEPVIWYE